MKSLTSVKRSEGEQRSQAAPSKRIDEKRIVATGLRLTRTMPLQDVSIVRLARELGITPGTIHYHLKGRNSLILGIINQFYGRLLKQWPSATGNWQRDLHSVATLIHQYFCKHPGIAAYYVLQNRYDVLIPAANTEGGEVVMQFFDGYLSTVARAGLNNARTSVYALILLQFIHITAYADAQHQWPGEHLGLKSHFAQYNREQFPSLYRLRDEFLKVTGDVAFAAGLDLIISGIGAEITAA